MNKCGKFCVKIFLHIAIFVLGYFILPHPVDFTTADQYIVVYDLSIGTIFNDLNDPLTQILSARHYLAFNISNIANTVLLLLLKTKRPSTFGYLPFLSASLYFSKRGAY